MAGREDGEATLKKLRQQLERGLAPGLYLLAGDDLFRLDEAQKAILDHLVPPGTSEFGLTVYGDEKVEVGALVSAALSMGMFAPRRVVLVRDVEALDGEPDALVAYAKKPPRDSFVVVRGVGLDLRWKLHKALAAAGNLLRFDIPSSSGAGRGTDVKRLAAARKLRLEPRAVAFLAEMTAGDLYRLTAELDKLQNWVASEATNEISLEVARDVAAGSDVLTGWEVAEAITIRDRAAALAAVARLVDSGTEPILMVGGVAARARALLRAKALRERGVPLDQATKGAWFFRDQLLLGLQRYTLAELLAFPAILLEADRALKSRSLRKRDVLENLARRLTAPSPAAPERPPEYR